MSIVIDFLTSPIGKRLIGSINPIKLKSSSSAPTEDPDSLQSQLKDFFSSTYSAEAIAKDRQWAEEQAQKQMDYQERMSSTAYQRAIKDLKAAGLNPALAYSQGGAVSSAGAMATSSSTQQQAQLRRDEMLVKVIDTLVSGIGNIVSSAVRLKGFNLSAAESAANRAARTAKK